MLITEELSDPRFLKYYLCWVMCCKTSQTWTLLQDSSNSKHNLLEILKIALFAKNSPNLYFKSLSIYWHYMQDLCTQMTNHTEKTLNIWSTTSTKQKTTFRKVNVIIFTVICSTGSWNLQNTSSNSQSTWDKHHEHNSCKSSHSQASINLNTVKAKRCIYFFT